MRDLYRHMLEVSSDAVVTVNNDGDVVFFNHGAQEMFGYQPEEVLGKPIDFLIPEQRRRKHRGLIRGFLQMTQLGHVMRNRKVIKGQHKRGHIFEADAAIQSVVVDGKVYASVLIRKVESNGKSPEDETSAELYREFIQRSPELILQSLPDGTIQFVNPASKYFYGVDHEELVGRNLREFLTVEDYDRATEYVRKVIAEGEERGSITTTVHRADGTLIDVLWSFNIVYNDEGEVQHLNSFTRDVSDLKDIEKKLREKERHYLEAQALAHLGNWTLDFSTQVVTWSDEIYRIFGQKKRPLTLSDVLSFIHPEDRGVLERVVELSQEIDEAIPFNARIVRPNGEVRYTHSESRVVRDDNGKTISIHGTTQDVTELKQYQETLSKQANLLDLANDAIIVTNLKGVPNYMNLAAKELFGVSDEEILDVPVSEQFGFKFEREGLDTKAIIQIVLESGGWTGGVRYTNKEGREIVLGSRITLVRNNAGEPDSLLIINRDLTEQVLYYSRSSRSQRLESIGALAGGIAHDLNNILMPISMALPTFQELSTDKETLELYDMLEANIARGQKIIRNLLGFARGNSSERIPVPVKPIADEVHRIIKETFPQNIVHKMIAAPDLVKIQADPTEIHQILMNLVVNARDALSGGGELSIKLSNYHLEGAELQHFQELAPGTYLEIIVEDTGSGMEPEIIKKVFEPFFTTKERQGGTGLGLSTTLRIVQEMSGMLDVWSEPGAGTRFRILLPACEGEIVQLPTADQKKPENEGELVLVVDDESSIRTIISKTLKLKGFRSLEAENGDEGLKLLEKHGHEIKALILDYVMPGMSGKQFLEKVLLLPYDPAIIVTSGDPEKEHLIKNTDLHYDLFLAKPYSSSTLILSLKSVLETHAPHNKAKKSHAFVKLANEHSPN